MALGPVLPDQFDLKVALKTPSGFVHCLLIAEADVCFFEGVAPFLRSLFSV
jgi:hypothetical protein